MKHKPNLSRSATNASRSATLCDSMDWGEQAQDHREWSEARTRLEFILGCSNKVIDMVIFELEVELKERQEKT